MTDRYAAVEREIDTRPPRKVWDVVKTDDGTRPIAGWSEDMARLTVRLLNEWENPS